MNPLILIFGFGMVVRYTVFLLREKVVFRQRERKREESGAVHSV